MSSVSGLNESPQIANVFPAISSPNRFRILFKKRKSQRPKV